MYLGTYLCTLQAPPPYIALVCIAPRSLIGVWGLRCSLLQLYNTLLCDAPYITAIYINPLQCISFQGSKGKFENSAQLVMLQIFLKFEELV